jgi:hypothetical protein
MLEVTVGSQIDNQPVRPSVRPSVRLGVEPSLGLMTVC